MAKKKVKSLQCPTCKAVVQAKDERAKRFYLACAEFIEYPSDTRTLFLPIETVIAAFG